MLEDTRNAIFTMLKTDGTVTLEEMMAFTDLLKGINTMLTPNEATNALGVSRQMLHKHVKKGKVHPAHQNARANAYPKWEIDALAGEEAHGDEISMKGLLSTKAVMQILGLVESTIAFYDQKGFLHPVRKEARTHRRMMLCKFYDRDEVYALKKTRESLGYFRCPTVKIREMLANATGRNAEGDGR